MDAVTTLPVSPKSIREQFGLRGVPTVATKVYRRGMPHDSNERGVVTASWIMLTPDGKRVHANTYNGKLGKNVDVALHTHEIPTDAKAMKKVLKGYEEVNISDCPIATGITPAAPATITETPAAEAQTIEATDVGDVADLELADQPQA